MQENQGVVKQLALFSDSVCPPKSQGRCLTQQRYYCQPNATTRVHSDVFGDYVLPNGCYFQVLVVRQHDQSRSLTCLLRRRLCQDV